METQNKKSVPPFLPLMLLISGVAFLLIGAYFMYTTRLGDSSMIRNVLFLCGFFDLTLAGGIFLWQRRQKENL